MSYIKFYKQRKDTTVCTPLAILNVFKLVGSKATKSSRLYKMIKKRVGFDPGEGACESKIGATLRSLGFKVKIKRNPPLKWLENEIRKEGVIVYSYGTYKMSEDDRHGHTELLIDMTPKCFIVVNAGYGLPTMTLQPKKYWHNRPSIRWSHAVVVLLKKVKE